MVKDPIIFLGVDPGTTRIGYGFVKKEGGKLSLIDCGAIEIKKPSASERLIFLEKKLEEIIKAHRPCVAGIEKLYFAKNKKTALGVAEARGVMLLTLGRLKIPILEFDPTDIKRTVAGDGHCDKKALAKMVCITLGEKSLPGPDDAHDALAIAIRASFERA
ncbi:MAG: crossover junction endodeoxyribonuclease RuvC [Candidatus Colwellbacteria bacterium]